MKKTIQRNLFVIFMLLLSSNTIAASNFVGLIKLVSQYAPGVSGSGALCYVGVPLSSVTNKPACAATTGSYYYYSWECDDPRRKGIVALALAAYMGGKKVELSGEGVCSAHPSYENINKIVISENP